MENDGDLPEVARGKRTDAQNSEVLNDLKYTNSLARYRLGTFEDMFGDKERSLEHDKDCHKLRGW